MRAMLPMLGGFLRVAPLIRDPPQGVKEVSWDGRQSGGISKIIPHG